MKQTELKPARTRTCEVCGEEFSPRTTTAKYCSRPCFYNREVSEETREKQRKAMRAIGRKGPKNPAYKHGKRRGFGEVRRHFNLELKGEEACRNCGVEGRRLHLHHAIPRSTCKATRLELLNGLPLCVPCHFGWHRHTITIYRDVFTEEEWAYLSAVELTGQRIEAWLDDHYPERPAEEIAA